MVLSDIAPRYAESIRLQDGLEVPVQARTARRLKQSGTGDDGSRLRLVPAAERVV